MKPQLVRGTRDFSAVAVRKRAFIFDTLKRIFIKYGFDPLETPAMEELSALTGKYGDEGDQLLFKILNNGDYLKNIQPDELKKGVSGALTAKLSKRALRYDLTVPFARYVALNRNALTFPFKRYQIQPVWRADNPQKGRYREFYQCDVDVIGSDSLLYEAELCQIYDEAFAALGIKVVIRLNNRKILEGIADYAGVPDQFNDIVVAIDKLDKIGWDGVEKELRNLQIMGTPFDKIKAAVECSDLDSIKQLLDQCPIGMQGVKEIEAVQTFLDGYTFNNTLQLDFSLARGLSYYTGCIYEVVVDTTVPEQAAIKMGSIGGGGRYADLTGIFGFKNMSGVGVSFGAERIYDVMEQLDLFGTAGIPSTQVLVLAMDDAALHYGVKALRQLRAAGIPSAIYPKAWKFQKLMKYANNVGVPYTILLGSQEVESGLLGFKNMTSGEQQALSLTDIIQQLRTV